jgi:methylated-DNA-[protein]-cysteine S-methyltransferase
MKNIHKIYYKSPIGNIEIGSSDDKILSIYFIEKDIQVQNPETETEKKCIDELQAYFDGNLQQFKFPVHFTGTDFQCRVWSELLKIPYGETISYGELSRWIKNPAAVRAVGSANGSNPLSIVVPCHRVIGSNGKLVGYGGGLWRKKWLLDHEKTVKYGLMTLF